MVKGDVSLQANLKQENTKFYITEPEQHTKNNDQPNNKGNSPLMNIENKDQEEPLVIPFQSSKQVLELLSQIEEKNLYYIQNTHESEEELEKQRKVLQELSEKNEGIQKENKERVKVLTNALNVMIFISIFHFFL